MGIEFCRAATKWVWILPALVLMAALVVNKPKTIFVTRTSYVWHQFFSSEFLIAEDWMKSNPYDADLGRGLVQLLTTCPLIAAISYATAASLLPKRQGKSDDEVVEAYARALGREDNDVFIP